MPDHVPPRPQARKGAMLIALHNVGIFGIETKTNRGPHRGGRHQLQDSFENVIQLKGADHHPADPKIDQCHTNDNQNHYPLG